MICCSTELFLIQNTDREGERHERHEGRERERRSELWERVWVRWREVRVKDEVKGVEWTKSNGSSDRGRERKIRGWSRERRAETWKILFKKKRRERGVDMLKV